MVHIFQDEGQEEHSSVCSFGCLWIRKLAKAMTKALKWQKAIFGTIIYENNGN